MNYSIDRKDGGWENPGQSRLEWHISGMDGGDNPIKAPRLEWAY